MKRVFLSGICLFFIFSGFAQNSSSQYRLMVAGFYNLENFFDTINDPLKFDDDFTPNGSYHYNSKIYNDKLERLSDVLSQIGTDVTPDGLAFWGTAEVENIDVLLDLVTMPKIADRNYKPIIYSGGDARGINCAFLYNPKYFKPVYSTSIPVDLKKAVKDGKPTRDILWVRGILTGIDTIDIFVGHWPSRRGGETLTTPMRNYVAGIIKNYADSIRAFNKGAKILVMGDLNDNPTDESIIKYLGATGKKEAMTSDKFFNPFIEFYKKGYGTLAHNDAWGLFDQIILSNGWMNQEQKGWFFQKAQIFKKDFMIQQSGKYKGYPKRTWNFSEYNYGYSDHFPTYIQLLQKIQ